MNVRSSLRALAAVVLILTLMPLTAMGQDVSSAQGALEASIASPRFALVIGNGDYQAVAKLNNPTNDATDISQVLDSLGFDTELLTDADLATMEDAILRFRDKLTDSHDSVGFFYYAGHGVQSGGENYLIPVDAHLSAESLLRTRAIPLQFVLDSLGEAGNALNIVVLDACRDNPFSWARSSNRGLAVVGQQPPASIVVYSTSAGKVAQDGSGRNGAFTEELLKHLATPGLDITEVLRRTGNAVQTKTNGAQIPAIYSQFFGFMQLAGGVAGAESGGTSNGASGTSSGADQSGAPSVLDYLPAFYDDAPMRVKLAIAHAEELAWDEQWLSAWKTIDAVDPDNRDPYILAEKIRIALDGSTSNNLYQGFTLADAPADGDTEAARQAGTLDEEYIDFDPNAAVRNLQSRGTKVPPVLASALGNFYYNAWYWCGDSYTLTQDETKAQALRWYDAANEAYIVVDPKNIMQYAELLMDAQRADEAVSLLKDETEWEPDNAEVRLKLVDAYIQVGNAAGAFAELDTLITGAANDADARDYYGRALSLAFDQNDQAALAKYLAGSEARLPGDWLADSVRHRVAVRAGDQASAQRMAGELMTRFPLNTDVLEAILTNWLEFSAEDPESTEACLGFLGRSIEASKGNELALGTYYFYRSLYRYFVVEAQSPSDSKTAAIKSALLDLDSAEKYLGQSPDANQQMRDTIPYIREELQAALQ